MVEIPRILCPIDFSDASRHALEHAVAVARWYDSQIVALYVTQRVFLPYPPILFAEFATPAAASAMEREAVERQMHEWLEPVRRAGVTAETAFDEGSPASQIVSHASRLQVGLIVMGTHGLSGFERLMLGSVAERVLRKAPCPVMTVPPKSATTANVPYTHLLCPVDFSESSLAALGYAFSLAEESDARLTILHVLDWPDNDLLVDRFDDPEFRRLVDSSTRARLTALVPDEARVWCKPATRVAYGKPYREIVDAAESDAVDLIVMGVRGRNPADLAVFGSTTNQVVRHAPCPVLTLTR